MNTVIPTRFCASAKKKQERMFRKFWKWKIHHDGRSSCKLAKCSTTGCTTNKREWVSVNGSRIGRVGWRRETLETVQGHTLQYGERGRFTEEEYQLSWKWKFVKKWSLKCIAVWFRDLVQLEVLISCVAEPNFRFRCNERGVLTGVRWYLGWRSVVWSLEV